MKRKYFVLAIIIIAIGLIFNINVLISNGATKDTSPPVLKSIRVKRKAIYNPGDKVYLDIGAYDDVSGIARISTQIFNKSDSNIYNLTLEVYSINNNPYIIIPENIVSGKYVLPFFYLEDNAGNGISYTNNPNFADNTIKELDFDSTITIEANGNDRIPPVLESINFSTNKLKYGDALTITAKISDDMSGVKHVKIGFTLKNDKSISYAEGLFLNPSTQEYECNIDAPARNGIYELSFLNLEDNAGNRRDYTTNPKEYQDSNFYTKMQAFEFTVSEVPETASALPELIKVNFEKKELFAPSAFEISIEISDVANRVNGGHICFALKGDSQSNPLQVTLTPKAQGVLTGVLDISQYANIGTYQITEIILGNSNELFTYYAENYAESLGIKIAGYEKIMPVYETFEIVESIEYDDEYLSGDESNLIINENDLTQTESPQKDIAKWIAYITAITATLATAIITIMVLKKRRK